MGTKWDLGYSSRGYIWTMRHAMLVAEDGRILVNRIVKAGRLVEGWSDTPATGITIVIQRAA